MASLLNSTNISEGKNDYLKKTNYENIKLGEEENWNAGALLIEL